MGTIADVVVLQHAFRQLPQLLRPAAIPGFDGCPAGRGMVNPVQLVHGELPFAGDEAAGDFLNGSRRVTAGEDQRHRPHQNGGAAEILHLEAGGPQGLQLGGDSGVFLAAQGHGHRFQQHLRVVMRRRFQLVIQQALVGGVFIDDI